MTDEELKDQFDLELYKATSAFELACDAREITNHARKQHRYSAEWQLLFELADKHETVTRVHMQEVQDRLSAWISA